MNDPRDPPGIDDDDGEPDMNDPRFALPPGFDEEQARDPHAESWKDGIQQINNMPLPNLFNACHMLTKHPDFQGVFRFDEFACRAMVTKPLKWNKNAPRPVADTDTANLALVLQREMRCQMHPVTMHEAINTVAFANRFHPVRDYVLKCAKDWDGERRLDSWLARYLGAQTDPTTAAFGHKWLVSAVARIFEPGCKADHVLVLEGPQSIGKSSAIKALGHPWTTDEIHDIGSKDAAMQLTGAWLVEFAELDSLVRARTLSTVKAYLTRSTERYRPPYGRHVVEQPRQCVFAGTVNEAEYLTDRTGNRRFWPVLCSALAPIDLNGIKRDRNQLWGEAYNSYRSGGTWYITDQSTVQAATDAQSQRVMEDPFAEILEAYITKETEQSPTHRASHGFHAEDLRQALRLEGGRDLSVAQWARVKACMTSLGYEKRQQRGPGERRRAYFKAE